MRPPSVSREDLLAPDSRALIEALNDELRRAYPEPGSNHFRLDPDEVSPGRGAFFVARVDAPPGPGSRREPGKSPGTPVACGAVRLLEGGDAEVKRMFARPEVRGRGVGRAVLAALEAEARRLGASRLVLETGVRQREAIALYRSAGFTDIPPYGAYREASEAGYVGSGLSLFLAKPL